MKSLIAILFIVFNSQAVYSYEVDDKKPKVTGIFSVEVVNAKIKKTGMFYYLQAAEPNATSVAIAES